mmetsp:Transcript_900/g.1879  ORF Transcript_900/g.1879 Transcript_900/m.1879 type:complete len:338 (+) Transcript_900:1984-2997(+)
MLVRFTSALILPSIVPFDNLLIPLGKVALIAPILAIGVETVPFEILFNPFGGGVLISSTFPSPTVPLDGMLTPTAGIDEVFIPPDIFASLSELPFTGNLFNPVGKTAAFSPILFESIPLENLLSPVGNDDSWPSTAPSSFPPSPIFPGVRPDQVFPTPGIVPSSSALPFTGSLFNPVGKTAAFVPTLFESVPLDNLLSPVGNVVVPFNPMPFESMPLETFFNPVGNDGSLPFVTPRPLPSPTLPPSLPPPTPILSSFLRVGSIPLAVDFFVFNERKELGPTSFPVIVCLGRLRIFFMRDGSPVFPTMSPLPLGAMAPVTPIPTPRPIPAPTSVAGGV